MDNHPYKDGRLHEQKNGQLVNKKLYDKEPGVKYG